MTLYFSYLSYTSLYELNKGDKMAKGKDVQKSVKKEPAKSMKEKKADKIAKKASK